MFEVAVDICKSSPNFGKWVGVMLSEKNKQHLWIPLGYAYGFVTLTDKTKFLYKTTDFFEHQSERVNAWNVPSIVVDWQYAETPQLSAKDLQGVALLNAEIFE